MAACIKQFVILISTFISLISAQDLLDPEYPNVPWNGANSALVPDEPICSPEHTNNAFINTDFTCCFQNCTGAPVSYIAISGIQYGVVPEDFGPDEQHSYPPMVEFDCTDCTLTNSTTVITGFKCFDLVGRNQLCEDLINKTGSAIFKYCTTTNLTRDLFFNTSITPVTVSSSVCAIPGGCLCKTCSTFTNEVPYINVGDTRLTTTTTTTQDVETYFLITSKPGPILMFSEVEVTQIDAMLKTTFIAEATLDTGFYVSLVESALIIHFGSEDNRTIIIRKSSYLNVFESNETDIVVDIPQSAIEVSGKMYVTIYTGSIFVAEVEIDVIGSKVCRFSDCILCSNAFHNWHCLSTYFKTMIILIFLVISCLLIGLFPYAWWGLWWFVKSFIWPIICFLFRMIFGFHRTRLASRLINFARRRSQSISEELSPMNASSKIEEGLKENSSPKSSMAEFLSSRNTSSKFIVQLICFCLIALPLALAQCSDGIAFTATQNSCVNTGATKTCSLKFTMNFVLRNVKDRTCFNLLDSKSNIIASGNVSYDWILKRISLEHRYSTCGFIPYTQSVFHCSLTDTCPGKCSSANVQGDKSISGILNDPVVTRWPGLTRCDRTVGCANNGCFSCSAGCVFSAFGLKPVAGTLEVYDIGQAVTDPTITLNLVFPNGTNYKNQVKSATRPVITLPFSSGTMKLTFIGAFSSDTVEFGTKKIVAQPPVYKLMDACPANSPCNGLVGDIQANVASAFSVPNPSAFIFNPTIAQVATQTKHNDYVFQTSTAHLWNPERPLPYLYQGSHWFVDTNGFLTANLSVGPAIEFQIATDVPIIYQTLGDVVCPVGELVSANGCFECDEDVVINVELKSTCAAGLITITTDADYFIVSTVSVYLDTTINSFQIAGKTSKQHNHFNLILVGSTTEFVIPVDFTAFFKETINNQTFNTIGGDGYSKTTDWKKQIKSSIWKNIQNFFDRIIKGVAKWWEYLIFSVVFVVVFLLTLWLLSKLGGSLVTSYYDLKGKLKFGKMLQFKKVV